MNSKYAPVVALTALGVVVVLLLGWFALISPKLSQASDLRALRDSVVINTTKISGEATKLAAYEQTLADAPDLSEEIELNFPDRVDIQVLRSRILGAVEGSSMEIISLGTDGSYPVEGWELDTQALTSTSIASLFETGPIVVDATVAADGTTAATEYVPPVVVSPAAGPVVDALFGMPFTLSVAGSYAETKQLLALLQASEQQLFLVYNLKVTARNEGAAPLAGVADPIDGDVIVNITGAFYYLDPQTAIVDEDGPAAADPDGMPFLPGDTAQPQVGAS